MIRSLSDASQSPSHLRGALHGEFRQASRRASIHTPLGADVLVLRSLEGEEEMSRLFRYRLELLAERDDLDARELVGESVTITLLDEADRPHHVHGVVSCFSYRGPADRGALYQMEVVPWLWLLQHRSDCRIFQFKTIPQIVSEVFSRLGLNDFELRLRKDHPQADYVVQYRESDFQFVSRLLEHEGIFYYFRHGADRHTMILGDGAHAYTTCGSEDHARLPNPLGQHDVGDNISSWEHRYRFHTGGVALADFNFEQPKWPVAGRTRTHRDGIALRKLEHYDYPGDCADGEAAGRRSRLRIEEQEAEFERVVATGCCRGHRPGHVFTVDAPHLERAHGQEFVVLMARHWLSTGGFVSGAEQASLYSNELEALRQDTPFVPLRNTPKGVVQGPQTATVVGPAGEEIYTDSYGRVKVQFHWDREGRRDENSSCWIRVSQAWAGAGYGSIAIPRIGQEVIVDFLEGDPDRPIITGRVYNAGQMQPQNLPEPMRSTGTGPKPIPAMLGRAAQLPQAKSRTTIRSNSSPGGGGANEILFDDAAGGELMYLNATKDAVRTVGNDDTSTVGANQYSAVTQNQEGYIGGDQSEFIALNRDTEIGLDDTLRVGSSQHIGIGFHQDVGMGGNQNTTIGGNQEISIRYNQDSTIGRNRGTHVVGDESLEVAKSRTVTVGTTDLLDAGEEIVIRTGAASIRMKKDGTIEISGKNLSLVGEEIKLSASGAEVRLDKSGTVNIHGAPTVKVNC